MLPFLPPDVALVLPARPAAPTITLAEIKARRSAIKPYVTYHHQEELADLVRAVIPIVDVDRFSAPRVDDEAVVSNAVYNNQFSLGSDRVLDDALTQLIHHIERCQAAQKDADAAPMPLHDQVRSLHDSSELVAALLKPVKHQDASNGVECVYYGGELLIWLDTAIVYNQVRIASQAILRFLAPKSWADVPKDLRLRPRWNNDLSTFRAPTSSPKSPWEALPSAAYDPLAVFTKKGRPSKKEGPSPVKLVASVASPDPMRYGLSCVTHARASTLSVLARPPWPEGAAQMPSELVATDGNQLHAYRLQAPPPNSRLLYAWERSQVLLGAPVLSQRLTSISPVSIVSAGEFPDYFHAIPSGGTRELVMSPDDVTTTLARLRGAPPELDHVTWQGRMGDHPLMLDDGKRAPAAVELPVMRHSGAGDGPARSSVAIDVFLKGLAPFAVLPYPVMWLLGGQAAVDPWVAVQADERGVVRQWGIVMPRDMTRR